MAFGRGVCTHTLLGALSLPWCGARLFGVLPLGVVIILKNPCEKNLRFRAWGRVFRRMIGGLLGDSGLAGGRKGPYGRAITMLSSHHPYLFAGRKRPSVAAKRQRWRRQEVSRKYKYLRDRGLEKAQKSRICGRKFCRAEYCKHASTSVKTFRGVLLGWAGGGYGHEKRGMRRLRCSVSSLGYVRGNYSLSRSWR